MSNPLTDVLPPRFRRYFYALLFVLSALLAAYQASDGNWVQGIAWAVAALGGATAASNVGRP